MPGVPALGRPPDRPLKRVGHRGADTVAPGNTLASFAAALDAGVDVIEFDVLRLGDGRLALAHDFEDAARREPIDLDEGLDHFAEEAYAGVELVVDLKRPGYEREVVEALAARGLVDRALVTTQYPESLDRVGRLARGLRRGWSVPRVRRRSLEAPALAVPAYAVTRYLRARLPRWAAAMLRAGRCDVIIVHRLLVGRALMRSVAREGGQLWVWAVESRRRLERLERLGVDGILTKDPRLFAAPGADGDGPGWSPAVDRARRRLSGARRWRRSSPADRRPPPSHGPPR